MLPTLPQAIDFPYTSTVIRSASANTAFMSCSTSTMVQLPFNFASNAAICSDSPWLIPAMADQIKRGFGGFAQRPGTHHGRPESKAVPKLRLGCQHDVLQCGEFIEYGSDLIGAGQSHAGTPINRDLCDIFSVKQDATLAWPGLARQLGNQG